MSSKTEKHTEIIRCEGCEKKCELNAVESTNPHSAGFYEAYYMPKINGLIINAYMNAKGAVIYIQASKSAEEAIKQAQIISTACLNHKMNTK